jgi:hypothetical protein
MFYYGHALMDCSPGLPQHVKIELKMRVRSFPSFFLLAPVDGEVFENADLYQERL